MGATLLLAIPLRAQEKVLPGESRAEARRAIGRSEWKAAEQELRREAANDGAADAELHLLLGFVLFHEGRATESLTEYTAAAKLQPSTDADLVTVASDYILLKDYADADHWLQYVTERSPGDANAWYLRGRTQYYLDRAEAAAASFRRVLELRPRDVRAEYNLGLALEKLDRGKEAEAAYRAAIEWQKDAPDRDAQPYLDLGRLMLARRQPADALAPLQEAVALAPRNPMAHQELGVAMEALARTDEAIAALRRASELAPDAEQPHFLLGRIYRRAGRSAEAAAEFAAVQRIVGAHSERDTPNRPQSADPAR